MELERVAGPAGPRPALVVSLPFTEVDAARGIGQEGYSSYVAYRAFAPLLERWGPTVVVDRPESRLEYALWRARQAGLEPVHLSFLPLHLTYLTARAPNVAFPLWAFPDIPDASFHNNPRNNWARIADRLALILTATTSTREAFVRAGVKTPIRVVPVPIRAEYLAVPAWEPSQRVVLECPAYVLPRPEAPPVPPSNPWLAPNPWVPARTRRPGLWARGKRAYRIHLKSRLPERWDDYLTGAVRAAEAARRADQDEARLPYPTAPRLELSGVIYTSILNPFDPRKDWEDLLSAYLLGLGDRDDATLVVKLVVPPELATAGLNRVIGHYCRLGLRHRCKLTLVTTYLSEDQLVELARASTYYVTASRAERAGLPLRALMAAGRPGVAPVHTALDDYFGEDLGFVVASHPEPASWPRDPKQRLTTTWRRLVWQSLHDQLRVSYDAATQDRGRYRSLGARARERMVELAGAERVWPRLAAALDAVTEGGRRDAARPPRG